MVETLRHRGPDGEGTFTAPGIALGMRRLAIVDLETGDQPLASEDGSIQLVGNGEIYNAPELQADLEARGHRFRGHSDMESVVHLYEDHGVEALHRLRGMFALAIWDGRRRRLLLARDRLGLKPLYYGTGSDGTLFFGSEAKAVLASSDVDRRLDPAGLCDMLDFASPVLNRTLFRGVRQLPAGHRLIVEAGQLTRERWWALTPQLGPAHPPTTEEGWVEAIHDKLAETVRLHLRGDVPVACWLSPGLDSSAVAALANREIAGRLPAISLGFSDPRVDELRHQRILSEFPEQELVGETVPYPDHTLELLPRLIWHGEQPFNLQGTYFVLARATDGRYKVALTGQGSDEIFGGYPWHTVDLRWRPVYGLPAPVRRLLAAVLARGKERDRRALVDSPRMRPSRFGQLLWSGWPEFRSVLVPELREAIADPARQDEGFDPPPDFERWNRYHQIQHVDAMTRLSGYINRGLDAFAMSHGIEPRLPFLDHEFVELALHVPLRLRQKRMEKYVLRRAVEPYLPPEIAWREKRGLFGPPPRLDDPGRPDFVDALLSESALREKGYADPDAVAALPDTGPGRRARQQVLALQLWDEIFVRGTPGLPAG
jgi:asparagine synthase (glutamine-hydrolysing)